ncbi:MAG: chorismate synthase [Atopobiaceae bacterium]|jgi:chorismate synthase
MPSSFGTALRVSVFGQSHSPAIGCVVEGLPSGFLIDNDQLHAFMARRTPGQGPWSTPRKEADEPQILSGLNPLGKTSGAPLAITIMNTNTRSHDYDNLLRVPRPGHSDFAAFSKWHGNQDIPGGGHFSGRLTAPLCAAGGIALQILATKGVRIQAHLARVGNVEDERFVTQHSDPEALKMLQTQMDAVAASQPLPTILPEAQEAMLKEIDDARRAKDSVGGLIECVATGFPAGIGSPMFDGLENTLARALFGIPAVKGLEFGAGFDVSRRRGSQNNDPYAIYNGTVVPTTNNAGGALGGISTGAPVVVRVALKPTSSISQEQDSVDLTTMEETKLTVHGRHDPCVAVRAVPVTEAVMALALLDSWLSFPEEGSAFTLSDHQ